MALAPGIRLGAYEILSALGAGGFGEVYKARDIRLDRTVAIKVLPSADGELKARFEREAKAIAALHGYRYASALLDVNRIDAATRVRGDLKRSRSVQAENYGMMLDAELTAKTGGEPLRMLDAAQKAGAWWAFYRAAVVLSRAHHREAESALRWCREHRAQGTAAFLDDVPTLRYYVAVEQPAATFR